MILCQFRVIQHVHYFTNVIGPSRVTFHIYRQSYNGYAINEGCYLFVRFAVVKFKLLDGHLSMECHLLFSVNLEEYLHESKH